MGRWLQRQKKKRKMKADRLDRLAEERDRLREDRQLKKIHKRHRKKSRRQKISEEDAQVKDLAEYTPEMARQLEEQDIQVDNPEDTVEVATKYNAEVLGGEEVPQEDYDKAYIFADDSFESYEEYVEERSKARNRIRNFFGVVGGAIKGAIEVSREKKRKGEPLTDADKRLLDLDAETRAYGKKQASFELQKLALPAVILLVLYILFKK